MCTPSRAGRVAGAFALALFVACGFHPASAAQFDVTNTDDAGPGSLRAALDAAALNPGNDEVVIQPGLGTITLSSALVWTGVAGLNAVTISGNGVRLDFAGSSARGLVDDGGHGVTVRDTEITGVAGTFGGDSGPVISEGGSMLLTGCTIFGNHVTALDGDAAGAVLSEGGRLTVQDCAVLDNTADADGDACGGLLSEGGPLEVLQSSVERNAGTADGDACGGVHSEGGDVEISDGIIQCNRGTSRGNGDAAGGVLNSGGELRIEDSTIAGNSGSADGEASDEDSILSSDETPDISNTTVDDSASACAETIESYFLPKNVNAKFNAQDPAKSSLITAGFFDTGSGVVDLSQAATLAVGGLTFNIPALTGNGKSFVFDAAGISFSVIPNKNGSSRAKFKLKATGDLTGKVNPSGDLTLRFTQGAIDAIGTVRLTAGRYTIGRVRGALKAPNIYLQRAKATLKDGSTDSLSLFVGLATSGVTPAAASDLTIAFGGRLSVTIPAGSFVKKGEQFKFAGNAQGITKASLDFARERITVTGKGLDLGAFAQGGNSVVVSVALGADQRAVAVRMARKGASMKY